MKGKKATEFTRSREGPRSKIRAFRPRRDESLGSSDLRTWRTFEYCRVERLKNGQFTVNVRPEARESERLIQRTVRVKAMGLTPPTGHERGHAVDEDDRSKSKCGVQRATSMLIKGKSWS